jgi:hypothetical protein
MIQHFTTARMTTFDFYPAAVPLGFDIDEYRQLVRRWHSKGDAAFKHRVSVDFPQRGGRQAQRAYNDALRDLLGPLVHRSSGREDRRTGKLSHGRLQPAARRASPIGSLTGGSSPQAEISWWI